MRMNSQSEFCIWVRVRKLFIFFAAIIEFIVDDDCVPLVKCHKNKLLIFFGTK